METAYGIYGVSRVDADHEADTVGVVIEDEISDDGSDAAIEQTGYDVVA